MPADVKPISEKSRVLLVEDHSLIRDGIRMLLALERDYQVVGEAGTVAQARELALSERPDIAIVDVGLPDGDGIDLSSELIRSLPDLRIVILTGDLSERTVVRALGVGAHAYVPKHHNADELFKALGTLREGGRYVSQAVAASYRAPPNATNATFAKLTDREREIVGYLREGQSSKHIARHLDLSVATVRKHRENIMAKLEVHSVAELIAIAMKAA
jgi:DNA-binding NarL/FixJ family response regulator